MVYLIFFTKKVRIYLTNEQEFNIIDMMSGFSIKDRTVNRPNNLCKDSIRVLIN